VTGQELPRIATAAGPRSRALALRLARVENQEVTCLAEPPPIFWSRGAGVNVLDADGNRYVDLLAGFGAAVLGYAHPELSAAVAAQAGELQHAMGDVYPAERKVELLEALVRVLPGGLAGVILSGSGSDAVESALKTALVATGRPGVVAFEGAYHGSGLGALDATHRSGLPRAVHARSRRRRASSPGATPTPRAGRRARAMRARSCSSRSRGAAGSCSRRPASSPRCARSPTRPARS
jgi:4-aminobutyrate aminotransferase/(S)-3-amino-2-methylpropionate transaminase